jgi:hypothetical protein
MLIALLIGLAIWVWILANPFAGIGYAIHFFLPQFRLVWVYLVLLAVILAGTALMLVLARPVN